MDDATSSTKAAPGIKILYRAVADFSTFDGASTTLCQRLDGEGRGFRRSPSDKTMPMTRKIRTKRWRRNQEPPRTHRQPRIFCEARLSGDERKLMEFGFPNIGQARANYVGFLGLIPSPWCCWWTIILPTAGSGMPHLPTDLKDNLDCTSP